MFKYFIYIYFVFYIYILFYLIAILFNYFYIKSNFYFIVKNNKSYDNINFINNKSCNHYKKSHNNKNLNEYAIFSNSRRYYCYYDYKRYRNFANLMHISKGEDKEKYRKLFIEEYIKKRKGIIVIDEPIEHYNYLFLKGLPTFWEDDKDHHINICEDNLIKEYIFNTFEEGEFEDLENETFLVRSSNYHLNTYYFEYTPGNCFNSSGGSYIGGFSWVRKNKFKNFNR